MTDVPKDPEPPRSPSTTAMVSLMAGAILAVAFLVAIVRGSGEAPPAEPARPRAGGAARTAEGPAPLGPRNAVARDGLTFTWERAEGMTGYEVTVYDPLMKKIWSSPRVDSDRLPAPPDLLDMLAAGGLYHWGVTGFTESGEGKSSPTWSFRPIE